MTGLKITDLSYLNAQDISNEDVIPIVDVQMNELRQMRVGDFKNSFSVSSIPYSSITNTPTTLAGYGITDAYTILQMDTILQAYSPNIAYAGSTADGMLSSADWISFNNKQNLLISGTNIKTINGESVLGAGDITIASSSGYNYVAITNNYTAVAKDYIEFNTTSQAITVTLPSTPTLGDRVDFLDIGNYASTNNLIVNPSGNNIMNSPSDLIVSTNNISFGLLYTINGWRVV